MEPTQPSGYILLIDINASWVRSLMAAVPGVSDATRRVHAWQVYGWRYWFANRSQLRGGKREQIGLTERIVTVPGWTRIARISTAMLVWKIRALMRRLGQPEAIVYTLPHYAGVAAKFRDCLQVYYAYDGYRFYDGWDSKVIGSLETQMLNRCNISFAISKQLQEDFRQLTAKPVLYSPNAASAALVSQLAMPPGEMPPDLMRSRSKIVGCVGQISESGYDWPLIEGVARALPECDFVFIGPRARSSNRGDAVERVLGLRNVRWLGPRAPSQLGAYFAGFDICFGPYAVTPLKDRGSALRMYDYLCTGKPVLFTPISEVCRHREYLEVASTAEECVELIRKMLSPDYRVDGPARRRFVLDNTWEVRAARFWTSIQDYRRSSFRGDSQHPEQAEQD